jgi:hypothetical protein
VAQAQVMQRLNLNWLANPVRGVPPNAYLTVVTLTAALVLCNQILAFAMHAVLPMEAVLPRQGNSTSSTNSYNPYGAKTTNPTGDIPTCFYVFHFLQQALGYAFFLYCLIITIKTTFATSMRFARDIAMNPLRIAAAVFGANGVSLARWHVTLPIMTRIRHDAARRLDSGRMLLPLSEAFLSNLFSVITFFKKICCTT